MKALVFHARKYEFAGKTGELVKGNSVSLLELYEPFKEDHEKGLPPQTVAASDEAIESILGVQLPIVCDVEWGRRPGPKGKPESYLVNFKPGKPWRLEDTLGTVATAPK